MEGLIAGLIFVVVFPTIIFGIFVLAKGIVDLLDALGFLD